jgi:hypothetical protein
MSFCSYGQYGGGGYYQGYQGFNLLNLAYNPAETAVNYQLNGVIPGREFNGVPETGLELYRHRFGEEMAAWGGTQFGMNLGGNVGGMAGLLFGGDTQALALGTGIGTILGGLTGANQGRQQYHMLDLLGDGRFNGRV